MTCRPLAGPLLLVLGLLCPAAADVEWKSAFAVYDDNSDGFLIVEREPPRDKYVAGGNFSNAINQTGWANLEIWTNGNYPDQVQVRAAGFLEGFLTHELIYMSFINTLSDYCEGRPAYCDKIRDYLSTNTKWVMKMYKKLRSTSSYWHQVGLFYEQLEGLAWGWAEAAKKTGHSMGSYGFMWFNIFGDMEEFEQIFSGGVGTGGLRRGHVIGSGSCSALVKVLPDLSDLLTSHVTWNSYESMVRVLKKYRLAVRETAADDAPLVAGHSASFSSYPGLIYSGDDFTVLSSGLVAMETTIGNSNKDLWKYVKPVGTVLEGVRSVVANRLATSGKTWTDVFGRYNSGTYNNQWMIVDYKRFKPGQPLKDDLLWVLEQLPSLVEAGDMTDRLRSQTYWPSYNCPAFPNVFNLSGQPALVERYGDWFTYERTPRALIFARDHSKVVDVDSLVAVMRRNDFREDPLSRCDQCRPPYSAENALSARNDLNPADGAYPFAALGHRSHGATDCKATDGRLMASLDFVAVAGPTHDPLPPFRWSQSDFRDRSHLGQPDLWLFDAVRTQWMR